MKPYLVIVLTFIMAVASSCNGKHQGEDSAAKNDSIMEENRYLNTFIDQIAVGMDSLVVGEGMLLETSPEGTPLNSKQQVMANLKSFEEIVNRQRDRIAELEKQLEDNKSASARSMKKIVEAMKAQLAEKDKEIAALKEEISKKDFDISTLNTRVTSLNKDIEGLTTKTKQQEEALVTQSDMMNEAYVLIGTKKELKAAGVLSSSGLFSKAKLNSADFNASKFKKVDIRNYTTATLNSKKPKVLTPSPSDSYTITDNGNGTSTLTITNPTAFWSVSDFLVIQLK